MIYIYIYINKTKIFISVPIATPLLPSRLMYCIHSYNRQIDRRKCIQKISYIVRDARINRLNKIEN